MLGTNNLLQGCSAENTAGKMERFLTSISLGSDKILLVAPPPLIPGVWVRENSIVDASRDLPEQYSLIAHRLGISYTNSGSWNIDLAYNGVHFTEQGHRDFAAGLLGQLVSTGSRIYITAN